MKKIIGILCIILLFSVQAQAVTVKISELPDGSSTVTTADTVPAVQGTTTKKLTVGSLTIMNDEVDALWQYGSGSTYTNATVMSACTAVGSDSKTIFIRNGTWTIGANVDFTGTCPNAVFKFANGAIFSHGSYTISIPKVEAGDYQIFSGTGAVTYGDSNVVMSTWHGSGATGIHKALDGTLKTLKIPVGTYQDVVIDKSDITLIVSEGAVFQTSSAGLVPAIKFSGVSGVEVQGRIVADGNKANNSHSYTAANLGWVYGTVAVYSSSYLSLGDIYVYNAWHDAVALDTMTFSTIKNITAKDTSMRGFVIYSACTDNDIQSVIVTGTSTTKAARIGGVEGSLAYRNHIGSITAKSVVDGVDIERYSAKTTIGSIIVDTASAGNGVKINDSDNVSINSIQVHTIGYHGVYILSASDGTSNVNIGNIIATYCGSLTGAYNGLSIYASGGKTTQGINIGQITSNYNGTTAGNGVYIWNDGSSTIQDINLKSIIANSNYVYGVLIDDAGTNKRINLGNVTASSNTTGDFMVSNGVTEVAWGNLVVSTANNEMGVATYKAGNRIVLDASATTVSTSGTGEDTLATKTVGLGTFGATTALHIVAAGTKVNTASNQKTLKFYFGSTSVSFISLSTANTYWKFEAYVYNITSSSQIISWWAVDGTTITQGTSSAAVDTTADVVVKITGEVGNTGTDTISQKVWLVERL